MSFIGDIQGHNTQLYPIVTIEPPDAINRNWFNVLTQEVILLSTNNVSLNHIHSTVAEDPTILQNFHFKPLLLNIPSIKESIGIESRKFKISNVSLDISNYEYEGKRFTDILSDIGLINWKVSIQFVSPTANKFSTIYDVDSWDGYAPNPSFYNAYNTLWWGNENQSYNGEANGMTKMVYQGIIRRITHDDTKCKIELEDLTEKLAHKSLPQLQDQNGEAGYLGSDEEIPDKYKNKPIPMVYGNVDRSPCVFDGIDIIIDKNDTSSMGLPELLDTKVALSSSPDSLETLPPLLIVDGEHSSYILETPERDLGTSEIAEEGQITSIKQWDYLASNNRITLLTSPLVQMKVLQCINISTPSIQLVKCLNSNEEADNLFEGFGKQFNLTSFQTQTHGNSVTVNNPLEEPGHPRFKIKLGASPQVDYVNKQPLYISLNGLLLPSREGREPSATVDDSYGHADDRTYVTLAPPWGWTESLGAGVSTKHIDEVGLAGNNLPNAHLFGYEQFTGTDVNAGSIEYDNVRNLTGDINFITSEDFPDFSGTWSTAVTATVALYFYDYAGMNPNNVNNNDQYIIQIRHHFQGVTGNPPNVMDSSLSMEGSINSASLKTIVDIDKIGNKDFYANVNGRKNADGVLMVNPIEIIRDLVVNELGHQAIDEAEYQEAKKEHKYLDSNNIEHDWKFGFTVNKKINSKKLIEDIAKSTKCFPKFKNDGTFGFNTIKSSYNYTDIVDGVETGDYNTATFIKESDVISYSFKKTKPEHIYRKVTVSYKKDYAQDSYLETAYSDDLGADPYYGIEKSSDAHLEFESDYIRDEGTANQLANFLLRQYKNDHLIFSLKLPLQYINLDIGDLVKFANLFNGVSAHGVNYTAQESVNEQTRFPMFMITSIKKNLDSVSIECMQLHYIDGIVWDANIVGGEAIDEDETLPEDETPPVVTMPPNFNVAIGDVFDKPHATITGHTSSSESWENGHLVSGGIVNENPTAQAFGGVTYIVTALDEVGNSASAATQVSIAPPAYDGTISEIQGWYTFGVDERHYAWGTLFGDNTNIQHLSNAFWFMFDYDGYLLQVDSILNDNHHYTELGDEGKIGGINILKVLQVSGFPNPQDDGLYALAPIYIDPMADSLSYWGDEIPMPYTNWESGLDDTMTSVFPNHWLCLQKIKMTKRKWNFQYDWEDSEIISSYIPEEGAWLTDPVTDNDHVMGADIFQVNTGVFINGEIIAPYNVNPDYDISEFVYPEIPLMIGGEDEVQEFRGGIHSSEISSIKFTDIPREAIVPDPPEGFYGDSNQDGFINILDIVGTVNYILIDTPIASPQAADYNRDGFVNILDIVAVVNYILGLGGEGD